MMEHYTWPDVAMHAVHFFSGAVLAWVLLRRDQ